MAEGSVDRVTGGAFPGPEWRLQKQESGESFSKEEVCRVTADSRNQKLAIGASRRGRCVLFARPEKIKVCAEIISGP